MNIFLNVGLPIICPIVYAAVGLSVFHRFRRRHLERGCQECERKIRQNLNYGDHKWNSLLCDKYDLGAGFTAAFWPVAWIGLLLWSVMQRDERPTWLVVEAQKRRIEELEREAGIR